MANKGKRKRGLRRAIKFITESQPPGWNPKTKQFESVGTLGAKRDYVSRKKEQFAAKMRAKPTSLERILESCLQTAIAGRFYIYRQWVEGGYILDFYVRDLRLAFEADGPLHDAAYDRRRDSHILQRGIRTIRFVERELRLDPDSVHYAIVREVNGAVAANATLGPLIVDIKRLNHKTAP